ncbi:MAG TPA: MarR family transcriptional regulator [Candidatus Enterenecus stercoripullorum]|nr:MarR family transcriptional regulator [Candidatus Enterenecus stercoripullorum]
MERSFYILLYRAFHIQRKWVRSNMQKLGVGAGQPKLLVYLSAHGPCHQKQLADYFDVDPANVSRMIDSLEKGGFVLRKTDEQNRRRDLVEVTEKGRQTGACWRSRCREVEQIMLRGFTSEEKEHFADYLARAYQNVQEETGREKP